MDLDGWFRHIRDRYAQHMKCGKGCTAWCYGLFDISLADALETIRLEREFQAKLDLPGWTRIEQASEVRRERDAAGRADEVEKVKNVEDLRAEFESRSFLDLELFRQRHIDIPLAVFVNNVASGITETEWSGHSKRIRVEPAFGRLAVLQVRIAKQVGALRRAGPDIGIIAGQIDRDRSAGLKCTDRVDRPSFSKFPRAGEHEPVRMMKARQPFLRAQVPDVLRNVVFVKRRTGIGSVVHRFRPCIIGVESQSVG